ncbi:hypothetical protein GOP47_0011142 [Adiantum capillus-veneris]|uniref:Uncharacterized protein n=1 Tax=Adiantum capillus-veneris TaxID=13818 RepID=A0A9D4US75_ADICA|nr:hypothetical protein GOP47_0011142 [Adiantum capillus-veneris]
MPTLTRYPRSPPCLEQLPAPPVGPALAPSNPPSSSALTVALSKIPKHPHPSLLQVTFLLQWQHWCITGETSSPPL